MAEHQAHEQVQIRIRKPTHVGEASVEGRGASAFCRIKRYPKFMLMMGCALVAVLLTAGGCVAWTAPHNKIESLPWEERDALLSLPILEEGDLSGKEHAVLDGVKGTACQYRRDDPPATETTAMNEAKYWAKQQGAEAVKNMKCEPLQGKSLFQACWARITCTGLAIKFAK